MIELTWQQAGYPVLALLQLLPLLGAMLVHFVHHRSVASSTGILIAATEMGLAIDLYRRFNQELAAFQFAERLEIAGPLAYHTAVDGISVLFILLTALLTLLIVIYGAVRGLQPASRFLVSTFLMQTTLMGAIATVDLLWFVLLSIIGLIIVADQIAFWGTSPEKDMAVKRYLQFMGSSAVLLLAGTVILGWNYADVTGDHWHFNLLTLKTTAIAPELQTIIFFLLFYGLAIRTPLFPLHGWLPLVAQHGTLAVAPAFLLGVKLGVYGLLRYVFPLVPDAVIYWHPYVVTFAMAGIFYAAVLAMMQINVRRLLAFAVVSHTSILVIGLFSMNTPALQGSIMLSVNFGLAIAALLFMNGLVYRRTRTARLDQLGGLFDRIPVIGITFLAAGLSIVGMPGTPGFDAAHLVLEGAIARFGTLVTIAASVGNVIAAGFLLWAFQRAFLAPRHARAAQLEVDPASTREWFIAITVLVVLLVTGFFSSPWLELIDITVAQLGDQYQAHGLKGHH